MSDDKYTHGKKLSNPKFNILYQVTVSINLAQNIILDKTGIP